MMVFYTTPLYSTLRQSAVYRGWMTRHGDRGKDASNSVWITQPYGNGTIHLPCPTGFYPHALTPSLPPPASL